MLISKSTLQGKAVYSIGKAENTAYTFIRDPVRYPQFPICGILRPLLRRKSAAIWGSLNRWNLKAAMGDEICIELAVLQGYSYK